MNINPLIVVSNGWGVQSMTVLAMVALGDLPQIDYAIHSDTLHERSSTYTYAVQWTPWLNEHGVKTITAENRTPQIIVEKRKGGEIWIPAFTRFDPVEGAMVPEIAYDENDEAYETGELIPSSTRVIHGQLRRQCTQRWKIAPLRRWLQANRNGRPIEQWLNISMDEWQRAKDSDRKYIVNRFPLLEQHMTRNDCVNYLERHGIEVPTKSACVFCPFHDMQAWREMKTENGADWQEAIRVDALIRKVRPPHDLFLHQRTIPLTDVDLRTPEDRGQLALWQEVCDSGHCWV